MSWVYLMVDSTEYSMVVRLDERLVDMLAARKDDWTVEKSVWKMASLMAAKWDGTKAVWRESTMVESMVES